VLDSFGRDNLRLTRQILDRTEERFHLTGARKALTMTAGERERELGRIWECAMASQVKIPPESNSAVSQNAQNL
jgi:hypothetical protein